MSQGPADEKTALEAAWASPIVFDPLRRTLWTTQRPRRGRWVQLAPGLRKRRTRSALWAPGIWVETVRGP